MIIIVAKSIIKEEKIEEYITMAKELINESKKEKGCKFYKLHKDIENKNILTFIEGWENKEAINNHNETVHFKIIVPKLKELQEKDSEVNLYKVIE